MTTAIVSALTGIPVRADVAMTGEITLRGEVTAIGGLKEKLLAALRGGIKTVLIPEENAKDLQDIPENVKQGLEIVPVKWIDKVLEVALERQPTPLTDDEVQAPRRRSIPRRWRPRRQPGRRRSSTEIFQEQFEDRHFFAIELRSYAGVAQLVERNLAKVEVESSRLFSRSRYRAKREAPASLFLVAPRSPAR
jgi:hypothetical protein